MDVRTVFCTEKCCRLLLRGWQRLLCRYGRSYRRDRSRPLRSDLRQTGGQLLKGAYLVADLLIQHCRLGCDGLIEAGKLGGIVRAAVAALFLKGTRPAPHISRSAL